LTTGAASGIVEVLCTTQNQPPLSPDPKRKSTYFAAGRNEVSFHPADARLFRDEPSPPWVRTVSLRTINEALEEANHVLND
jgi:hypothetical protein